MKTHPSIFALLLLLIISCKTPDNNTAQLRSTIQHIVSEKKAQIGVSIIGGNGKDTLSLHGDSRFPLQSIFKVHLALTVLSEIDKGHLSLDQPIEVPKNELLPSPSWSPLRDQYPEGGQFTLSRLLQYTISHSDNTACDVLIRLVGTPKTLENYVKSIGIDDLQITFNEKDLQLQQDNMFQNWTTPKSASKMLKIVYDNANQLLSKSSYEFFWNTLKETRTGEHQIRGQLPPESIVAHKTGSSGRNPITGITAALNNIGIVFLPQGDYFIISVFITASKEDFGSNEKIISDLSKAVYDFYTTAL
ncbi:MAG: class A beta-lactamase [Bacteroidales bacterium]